jgi:TolB-like protein
MKKQLTVLIFTILATFASAADQPPSTLTVAVYDFKGEADSASFGNKVTTLVTADLTAETNLVMLERADLDKILNEQAFGISAMVSSDEAAKIGQVTGVKVLVAGQVIKTEGDHLIIVASIIGTETGRYFAVKAEGAADNLMSLTLDLSHRIARTIIMQTTNLVAPASESREDRVKRIVKSIAGTNRPSVSINITENNGLGGNWRDDVTESELGILFLKAGFAVVDENSDKKADVQIVGTSSTETGLPRGGLLTGRATVDVKIQARRTGEIIGFDNQESTATDIGGSAAAKAALFKAADELAERILPLLAK